MFKLEKCIDGRVFGVKKDTWVYQSDSIKIVLSEVALKPLPDGRFIRKYPGWIEVWDSKTEKIEYKVDSSGYVEYPEQKQIIFQRQGNIMVYHNGEKVTGFRVHEFDINTIVTLGGGIFASADNKTIKVWNLKTRKITHTLIGPGGYENQIQSLLSLPDGKLVSLSQHGTVRLWDLTTRTSTVLKGKFDSLVAELSFLRSEENYFIIRSSTSGFEVWNPESEECFVSCRGSPAFLIPYTETRVIIGCMNDLKIINVVTKKVQCIKLEFSIRGATLIDESNLLVWFWSNGLVVIFNLQSLQIVQTLKSHSHDVATATVLSNGKIVSTSLEIDEIIIWSREDRPFTET